MRRLARIPARGWLLHRRGFLLLLSLAILLLSGTTLVLAQTGGGYDLSWWTVDGGGGTIGDVSSGYALMSTAGQHDAGAALADGGYTLVGGFWPVGVTEVKGQEFYLPFVMRNFP